MNWDRDRTTKNGGSAPATLGFSAVGPEWLKFYGAAEAAPAVPAAESTLGSHPCVALSSAQVISEWSNRGLAVNAFAPRATVPTFANSRRRPHHGRMKQAQDFRRPASGSRTTSRV